eukprot:jgi/Ulvmu1/10488/UM064_0025.1
MAPIVYGTCLGKDASSSTRPASWQTPVRCNRTMPARVACGASAGTAATDEMHIQDSGVSYHENDVQIRFGGQSEMLLAQRVQRLRNLSKMSPQPHPSVVQRELDNVCRLISSAPDDTKIKVLNDAVSTAISCGLQSHAVLTMLLSLLQQALSTPNITDATMSSVCATLVELRSALGGTDAGDVLHGNDTGMTGRTATRPQEDVLTPKERTRRSPPAAEWYKSHAHGSGSAAVVAVGQDIGMAVDDDGISQPDQLTTARNQRRIASTLANRLQGPLAGHQHVSAEVQSVSMQACAALLQQAQRTSVCIRTVAHVMWCCCHWGLDARALFPQLDRATVANLSAFSQRDIAVTAWTLAMLSYSNRSVLEKLAQAAAKRLPISDGPLSLTLNQSSTVAWAFGQLGIRYPGFWHKLTSTHPVLRSADGFAAPNAVVVRLLWGMASAGHRNVAVLQSIAGWMNNGVQLKLCRSDYVPPIIRSFAMLHYSPGESHSRKKLTRTHADFCELGSLDAQWRMAAEYAGPDVA